MNQDLADIFREMAALFSIKEVPFKPRAYEYAATSLEELDRDVEEIYKENGLRGLEEVPGVGKGIAEKIEEYIQTSHIKEYEKMKKALPVEIAELSRVEGLGPKTIQKLYKKLKIKNIADLEQAIKEKKIEKIEGLSEKTQQKLEKSLAYLRDFSG